MVVVEKDSLPGGEYMNEDQVSFFKSELRKSRSELLDRLGEYREELVELSVSYADPIDQATQQESRGRLMKEIAKIQTYIRRLGAVSSDVDSGEFGYCSDCGEEIGLQRLMARLIATECVDCKSLSEIKGRLLKRA